MTNLKETMAGVSTWRDPGEALLTCVRQRAQLRVLWMRSQWEKPAESSAWVISETEVSQILEDPAAATAREEAFYRSDASAREIAERIREADSEFEQLPEWLMLRRLFALSEMEFRLLLLAVALEADSQLSRVFGYLHDDVNAGNATPWLAARLFHIALAPLSAHSPLFLWRLAVPAAGAAAPGSLWSAKTPWTADPHIAHWLLGFPGLDPAIRPGNLRFLSRSESLRSLCLYPDLRTEIVTFIESIRSARSEAAQVDSLEPIKVELAAEDGSGKSMLAAQCACSLGLGLLAADADLLLSGATPAQAEEAIIRVARMAILSGSAIYWSRSESLKQSHPPHVSLSLDFIFFGSQRATPAAHRSTGPRRTFHLPALRKLTRSALWSRLSHEPVPLVVEEWLLNPAEIAAATEVAAAGQDAVVEVCRENLAGISNELFANLPCPFTWDDMVLSPHTRVHLEELEQQVRLRWQVYEEWGFERLCAFGSGITAMFSGPSGTGKTMAAQVLARSLQLQLYRVDLSGVMNKYIGETEKRLKQVFDACERSNVLLFFDEADALFGRRTQVEHAHDRFANIEIDYLLQRMEQFTGIAVLATNRKSDMDEAFLRRIRFMVDFQPPGAPERRALWQRALPPRSPAGEEILGKIDWGLLAQKLDMTGADIASAALNAAFLARADGGRITMDHVLRAARREMNKHGVMLRAGDWEI
jgi:hypothetical protein